MTTVDTKYFGPVEYEADDLVHFSNGLFGFEGEKSFLLLPFAGSQGNLLCLQSAATPLIAFVAMNPFSLLPSYNPVLQAEELAALGVSQSGELGYYVLCTVREPVGDTTVNLKCPVVINPETRAAAQVILETGDYRMRHRLAEFRSGEASPTC